MYDIERIGKIIADIQKYISELKMYNVQTITDLKDSKTFHATAMVVFAILNRMIDLGTEIISAEHLGAPQTYQEIMPLLAAANIINKEQSTKLNDLIKDRNTLAHFYNEITAKELLKAVKEMPSIEQFLKTVKKRVQPL